MSRVAPELIARVLLEKHVLYGLYPRSHQRLPGPSVGAVKVRSNIVHTTTRRQLPLTTGRPRHRHTVTVTVLLSQRLSNESACNAPPNLQCMHCNLLLCRHGEKHHNVTQVPQPPEDCQVRRVPFSGPATQIIIISIVLHAGRPTDAGAAAAAAERSEKRTHLTAFERLRATPLSRPRGLRGLGKRRCTRGTCAFETWRDTKPRCPRLRAAPRTRQASGRSVRLKRGGRPPSQTRRWAAAGGSSLLQARRLPLELPSRGPRLHKPFGRVRWRPRNQTCARTPPWSGPPSKRSRASPKRPLPQGRG